jgi:hypothetical protein
MADRWTTILLGACYFCVKTHRVCYKHFVTSLSHQRLANLFAPLWVEMWCMKDDFTSLWQRFGLIIYASRPTILKTHSICYIYDNAAIVKDLNKSL